MVAETTAPFAAAANRGLRTADPLKNDERSEAFAAVLANRGLRTADPLKIAGNVKTFNADWANRGLRTADPLKRPRSWAKSRCEAR